MNQRKRLTQRKSRSRRAHRKTMKSQRSTHRRLGQRGAGFFDFMKSINPFASSELVVEAAPVTIPTPSSIRRMNNMAPSVPAQTAVPAQTPISTESMPSSMPSMRRRRNYRKNL